MFSKYFCANINLPCTLSQGLLSTFPSCFTDIYYKIFLCANIVSRISINHALNPKAFTQLSQVLFANIFQNMLVQILFCKYWFIMHSTPGPSLNFPRCFLRIFYKICWRKYCFVNINLLCTQPQGLLSTFPTCFLRIFSKICWCKYRFANIDLSCTQSQGYLPIACKYFFNYFLCTHCSAKMNFSCTLPDFPRCSRRYFPTIIWLFIFLWSIFCKETHMTKEGEL